ncbi:MAG: C25 family cysteine peptidase [Rikenellaceae bacterium]
MAFCHNCGNPHAAGDKFCQNCGTKLSETTESNKASELRSTVQRTGSQKSGSDSIEPRQGVIMTNVSRLARRFNETPSDILHVLNTYIDVLEEYGIYYYLLDTSDKGCGDSWEAHSRELTDMHVSNFKGAGHPIFLFIIGGDDIVPMPVVENLYYHARAASGDNSYRDKDVDSDLPYAYLLGEQTQALVYNGELFNYTPYYCVGRLPFDSSCDLNRVVSYLKRSIECHRDGGVKIESSYAQTFKNWCNESVLTSSIMNHKSLLPPYSERYTEEFTFHNLLTSPGVVVENIAPAFNTDADLLFFNMHGTDNPTNPNFLGESNSFSPDQLATLTKPNIMVTEACYGAKFKGLDSSKSMLLSALKGSCVAYFGSSRIALGGGGYTYSKVEDLMSADLYFKYLLDALTLSGYPIGYSVEYARARYIKSLQRLELKDLLTIAEFNLYGDPTICSKMVDAERPKEMEAMKLAPLAEGRDKCGFTLDKRYESGGGSLLSRIRNEVDSSLKQIVESINRELYDLHGVQPRDLSSIVEVRYKDKSSSMEFVYSKQQGELNKIYVVQSEAGVNKILISK